MKFRTECEISLQAFRIEHDCPIVGVGSCFADNLTKYLQDRLFPAINPLGVLFNPLSIARTIQTCINADGPEIFKASLFRDDEIIHSRLFDSHFSSDSISASERRFKEAAFKFRETLQTGKTLLITFGTSYGYFLTENPEQIVANCHKQPAGLFTRRLISINEIVETWEELLSMLFLEFGGLNVIFTVSPVRHLRDGLHENNISKSILLLSVEELCRKLDNCHYFPAYELLIDDLRDYRFYSADLTHPSVSAIEYISEKFIDSYFSESALNQLKTGQSISNRLSHKPIINSGKTLEKFKMLTRSILINYLSDYPQTARLLSDKFE